MRKPTELTHESCGGSDLIYVYLQNRENYKTHRLSQVQVEGEHHFDGSGKWMGLSFCYDNNKEVVTFNGSELVAKKTAASFMVDINDLGIYGIEDIDSVVGDIALAKPYMKKREEE